MAKMAVEPLMRASERKLCLLIVIEPPKPPAIRVVTEGAIHTEAAFMIGILVAIGAFG